MVIHLTDKIGVFIEVLKFHGNYAWMSVKFKLRNVGVNDSSVFIF